MFGIDGVLIHSLSAKGRQSTRFRGKQLVDAISLSGIGNFVAQQRENDPLRRFTPTRYIADLPVMDRTVRLETNSSKIRDHMAELFAFYPGSGRGCVDFTWKIVSQADIQICPPWPKRHAFSDDGLRYAEFGQQNFLAVDLEAREAVAFIADGLVADKIGFTSPFLDNLFCMTASSLGLVSLWANCVAHGGKGLLVFGAQNSGKTTASYLATKLGLEFYADEGVFGEIQGDGVRVWGGFWPPVFRPDTLEFIPELRTCTQPLHYRKLMLHHLSTHQRRAVQRQPVRPVCCVFLERHVSGSARVSEMNRSEFRRLLGKNVLFKEEERFSKQYANVLAGIGNLPVHRLTYDSNPAVASNFFQDMLRNNDVRS
jgi:hypothetical protein